jgi:hypothetical protein
LETKDDALWYQKNKEFASITLTRFGGPAVQPVSKNQQGKALQ